MFLWQVLISIDQLANTVLAPVLNRVFGVPAFGHPDETLSSVIGKIRYAGLLEHRPVLHKLYNILNRLEAYHCEKSIEYDRGMTIFQIELAWRNKCQSKS